MRVALTVADFLNRGALVYGARTAVVDEPDVPGSLGRLTYAELEARARGMARGLDDLGVAHDDRVAIVSPNSGRFLTSYFGVSGYGRILVPINFRLTSAEIGYIVEHSGASVLLYDPELTDVVADIKVTHRFALDGVDDADLFAPAAPDERPAHWEGQEDGTCSVNYTSGTTARPKGVQLTQRNCWLNAATFGWHTGVSDRDVLLHTLPMFHCNGWGMPYAVTGMGGTHIVLRKVDGEEILSRIEQHGVTLLCGAPAVVAAILDAATARAAAGRAVPGRGTVRMVVAGAPPPSKTIERIETELGWEFIQIYGLTETSPLLTINRSPAEWDDLDPAERSQRLSRAGVPAIGVQIKVDEEGEVLARANHVFAGYWEQPDETAAALEDGWFHTGDGGYLDESYLVISDRKKDVIITGGENVSSIEVEDCLYQHAAVAEVAVIGVPDEKWGETIKALVVLRPGTSATEAELIAHCRDRLAHFKAPTSVEHREALDRTATGKLQKYKLRQPYWTGRDRSVN
ncbi:MAG TPA: AMP-binding protein [Acidimicrobiales bacterium]|jgi:acyl-CoA synthetase (AMP-forming)/AMP-acid ligase II|nr:AMP-binding protein [Acidimicrobiales bacterium]